MLWKLYSYWSFIMKERDDENGFNFLGTISADNIIRIPLSFSHLSFEPPTLDIYISVLFFFWFLSLASSIDQTNNRPLRGPYKSLTAAPKNLKNFKK